MNNLNHNIDPIDDFYNYCNNNWIKTNKIPSEYSYWNTFKELDLKNKNKIENIIKNTNNKTHDEKLIKYLYNTGKNLKKRDDQDLEYINHYIEKINKIETKEDIPKILALLHENSIGCLFNIFSSSDSKKSTINRLHLAHSFLSLPSKNYYFDQEFEKYRKNFKIYIKKLFKNKIDPDEIFNLEKSIANISLSNVNKRNSIKIYNKIYIDEFQNKFTFFNFKTYFSQLKIKTDILIYDNLQFYQKLDVLIKNISINQWKKYFHYSLLNNLSPYLSSYYKDISFTFYSKQLSGVKNQKNINEQSIIITNLYLDDIIGKKYVKKYFDKKSKKYIENIILKMKKTFSNKIDNLDWMSQKTKDNAKKKLKYMNYKIGYPNKSALKNYNNLKLNNKSFVNNILLCKKFLFRNNINKVDKKVNNDEWYMTPQTINAYYSPNKNEIVFPAAILQPPYFSIKQKNSQNYGAIGSIIGHEIIHGFDDQGRKFDYKGNLKEWWNRKDKILFKKESQKIIDLYNKQEIYGINVNGKLTLGENIADLGGVKLSMETLIDNYNDPDQLKYFFIAYANIWKTIMTKKESIRRLFEDPHAPNNCRVNCTLSNIEQFYTIFNSNNIPKNISKIW